jgi:hypothetical protein
VLDADERFEQLKLHSLDELGRFLESRLDHATRCEAFAQQVSTGESQQDTG